MKKSILFFCCYMAAMSVAQAQIMPQEQHDTTFWRKTGEAAMQNAPFVFRGRCIRTTTKRVNDAEWLVYQIVVSAVYRGNVAVGDTVELDIISGCYYDEQGKSVCPMHNGYPSADIYPETWAEQYFFTKSSSLTIRNKNSKQVFEFFDRYYAAAHAEVIPDGRIGKHIYRFYIDFENEEAFLKSLMRYIKPVSKPKKGITTPRQDRSKKQKSIKKAKKWLLCN